MRDKENAPKPSRRAIIAGLAAATAAAAPTIAVGSTDHPDRELIELVQEYADLLVMEKEAYAYFNECSDLYMSQEPVPRDCMRHTIKDTFELKLVRAKPNRTVTADLRYSDFYTDDEVADLRSSTSHRSEEAKARAFEIIAEWDRWQAECGALDESTGYSDAEEEAESVTAAMSEIEDKIIATTAKTIDGLRVRALVMKRIFKDADDEYTDARLVRAMIRDIETIWDLSS